MTVNQNQKLVLVAVVSFIALVILPPLAHWYGYHSAGPRAETYSSEKEFALLTASTAGCFYGVMSVDQDKKSGVANPTYTGEEDMKTIDFSTWKEVGEKNMPAFKEQFQSSLVACYRRYV